MSIKILEDDIEFANGQKVKDLAMASGKNFFKPLSRYGKVLFTKVNPSSIIIPVGFSVTVNDIVVTLDSSVTLDLNTNLDIGTKEAGLPYYILVKDDKTFFLSASKEVTVNTRLIGGFTYSLTLENELRTNYVVTSATTKRQEDIDNIKGINKYTLWDLWFMPENGVPENKALINGVFWRDLYFADEDIALRGYSSCWKYDFATGTDTVGTRAKIAGGATTSGRGVPKIAIELGGDGTINYGSLTQYEATEIVGTMGMKLLTYAENQLSAFGVVEEQSLQMLIDAGASYVKDGTIYHIPELTSKYGIEMATGVQFNWGCELMNGYGTTTFSHQLDKTGNRGSLYSTDNSPVAIRMSGYQDGTATSDVGGSRHLHLDNYVWNSLWTNGFASVCATLNQK